MGYIRVNATILSLLGIVNLLESQHSRLYAGIGAIGYQVDTERVPVVLEPYSDPYSPYSHHSFEPIGRDALIGFSVQLIDFSMFQV